MQSATRTLSITLVSLAAHPYAFPGSVQRTTMETPEDGGQDQRIQKRASLGSAAGGIGLAADEVFS